MNNQQLIKILEQINQEVIVQKDYLNNLDQAIGDGDHGTNVVRGFGGVVDTVPALEKQNPKKIMKSVAMTLMSKIGGSSGPLLGTLALQISSALPDGDQTTLADWTKGFEQGMHGIQMLAKAQLGDKTLLDALAPAIEALKANANDPKQAVAQAAIAARKGSDDTKQLEAKKGRASYLGARSVGHIDPGSVTMAIVLEATNKVVNNG